MVIVLFNYKQAFVGKWTSFFLLILVLLGLISAFVLPPIIFGNLSLYLVTLISPVVFFLSFYLLLSKPVIDKATLYPFYIGLVVVVSALTSWALNLSVPELRDLLESVKYVQFIPYLMALPFLSVTRTLKVMHYFTYGAAVVFLVVGFVQYFQIEWLNQFITVLYLGADSVHLQSSLSGYRITITGSDPNTGSIIACFFATYFLVFFFYSKKYFYFFIFLCLIFLATMTQSRTGMIAFVFGLGFYIIFYSKLNLVYKIIAVIFSFLIAIGLVLILDLQYLILGIKYTLEGSNASVNVRLENFIKAYERFSNFPLLGFGPAKSEFSTVIDSEYALILQRYGLIGIFVFLLYFCYLFNIAVKCILSHWGATLLIFIVFSLMVMFTNNIFSGYQIMSIIIFLNIATVVIRNKNSESNQYSQESHVYP